MRTARAAPQRVRVIGSTPLGEDRLAPRAPRHDSDSRKPGGRAGASNHARNDNDANTRVRSSADRASSPATGPVGRTPRAGHTSARAPRPPPARAGAADRQIRSFARSRLTGRRFHVRPRHQTHLGSTASARLTLGPTRVDPQTVGYDGLTVREATVPLARFSGPTCDVLLLDGSSSAPDLTAWLDGLSGALPKATRVILRGVGQTAADNGGRPYFVAIELRRFTAAGDGRGPTELS